MSRVLFKRGESRSLRESPSKEPHECCVLMANIDGCSITRCHDGTWTEMSSSGLDRASTLRNASEPRKSARQTPSYCEEMSSIFPKRNALAIWAAGFLGLQEASTTGHVSSFIYTVLTPKNTPLALRNTWHASIRTIVNLWHR